MHVLGGCNRRDEHSWLVYTCRDGEVFDPAKREWEPLGAKMASLVSVSAAALACRTRLTAGVK